MIGKTASWTTFHVENTLKITFGQMNNDFVKLIRQKVNFTDIFSACGKGDNFNSKANFDREPVSMCTRTALVKQQQSC